MNTYMGINEDDSIALLNLSKKSYSYLENKTDYHTMGNLLSKTEKALFGELPRAVFLELKERVEMMGLRFALSIDDEIEFVANEITTLKNETNAKKSKYDKLVEIYNDSVNCKQLIQLMYEKERLIKLNKELDQKIDDITAKILGNDEPTKVL